MTRLGAADDDDVGATQPDHVQAEGDRLVAGGARRDRSVCAGLGAEPQADVAGRGIGHQHRNGQRADPPGALLLLNVPVAEQGVQAADAGGDGDAEAVPIDRVVLLRGHSRRRCQASIAATTPSWAERSSRRASTRSSTSVGSTATWAAILTGKIISPVGSICADAGLAGQQGVPGAGRITAQRVVAPRPVTTTRVRDM